MKKIRGLEYKRTFAFHFFICNAIHHRNPPYNIPNIPPITHLNTHYKHHTLPQNPTINLVSIHSLKHPYTPHTNLQINLMKLTSLSVYLIINFNLLSTCLIINFTLLWTCLIIKFTLLWTCLIINFNLLSTCLIHFDIPHQTRFKGVKLVVRA